MMSYFSEYETLGTYFFATHRDEYARMWLLARAFDFVSFEGWDKGKNPAFMYPRLFALILRRSLVNYTRRVQADGAGSV